MAEDIIKDNKEKSIYTGKIIEIKDTNEIIIKMISNDKIINIILTDKVTFDEGIPHEFELGNIIMFEARDLFRTNEDNELIDIEKVIANEKDALITLDKRESISSILGVFPDVILDEMHTQTTVKKDSIIAIIVSRHKKGSWEYVIDNENIRLINESIDDDSTDDYEKNYLAFIADNIGESEVVLKHTQDNKVVEEIVFNIYINT